MGTFLEPALEQAVKRNPETPSRFRTGQTVSRSPEEGGSSRPDPLVDRGVVRGPGPQLLFLALEFVDGNPTSRPSAT